MILVGGEALFDVVAGDGDALEAHPGGGPFNAARTIARLDQPVAYLGRLSTDRFGDRLERSCSTRRREPRRRSSRTEDPTTLALAELGDGGSASRYRFYSAGHVGGRADLRGRARRAARARSRPCSSARSGSCSSRWRARSRPSSTASRARHAGRRRPELPPARDRRPVGLPRAGCGGPRAHATWSRSPRRTSRSSTPAATRSNATARAARRRPVGRRCSPAAATARRRDERPRRGRPAAAREVVDTIGAGDAFAGGFLSWWRERDLGADALADLDTVVEAATFACLVAARTCERAGASPPYRREL